MNGFGHSSSCRLRLQTAKALERLASVDLLDLCNEVKIEECRVTRGHRICGGYVKHTLVSCGHASLCDECIHSCDKCPICETPFLENGCQLRLFDECVEAGYIRDCNDMIEESECIEDAHLSIAVERLHSLFDAALRNNLVSLICQYVMDVCMDESAVSSDPITAFLLDEAVVSSWCAGTFTSVARELDQIYGDEEELMEIKLDSLLDISVRLAALGSVVEHLESSIVIGVSAQKQDILRLKERVLKTRQHLLVMMWCMRNSFLENVRPRHLDFSAWRDSVNNRRVVAASRSWPDAIKMTTEKRNFLFIEDSLALLELEKGCDVVMSAPETEAPTLIVYPFKSVREAVDVLFLSGRADAELMKQMTLLYYLFDRHWCSFSDEWRVIVDDFAAAFAVAKSSVLESFCFFLLDDSSNDAFTEAQRIIPEISSPRVHPKVAQVLLERGSPDAALMVLRWSGRDSSSSLSLGEAVTAIRARVECGLLTEAFMYQRRVCASSPTWVETSVVEMCCLCLRRNLMDRAIELPWNSEEERHIHGFLLEHAREDPLATSGSLLVAFYLRRHRHGEAFEVHRELEKTECVFPMNPPARWRSMLVENAVRLLPDVQQRALRSGDFRPAHSFGAEPLVGSPVPMSVVGDRMLSAASAGEETAARDLDVVSVARHDQILPVDVKIPPRDLRHRRVRDESAVPVDEFVITVKSLSRPRPRVGK